MNAWKKAVVSLGITLLLWMSCAGGLADIVPLPIDLTGGMPPKPEGFLSDTVYEDESIRVDIELTTVGVTPCYIARIKIADPSQLRTVPARSFERDYEASVPSMIKRVNAVFTINGDYFSFQKNKGSYLVRQGVTYMTEPADTRDVLIIDGQGDFYIEKAPGLYKPVSVEAIEQHPGIVNTFNFGPGLVVDGEKWDSPYNPGYCSASKKSRRVAIGQMERGKLEYICVVCDGVDTAHGEGGLTLQQFADFVATLGAENIYNLDGGNSAAFFLGDHQFNYVSGGTRSISDIIYFASAASD